MHREPLLRLLNRFLAVHPGDRARLAPMLDFVRSHADCFSRSCPEGHVTGSAWILSPDHRSVLLTHHRKLDRWLQLGGHTDGDTDVFRAALREAREESGMQSFHALPDVPDPLPLDVDVHEIPARGAEPAHLHFDVRFLLVAGPEPFVVSWESHDLRWVERARLDDLVDEESLLRMERRAEQVLQALQT